MANTTQTKMFGSDKDAASKQPVECFGIKFPNDEARRQYFLEKLRKKLKESTFRNTKGFPIGEDEDILALSDPPYYTACPNPFFTDFVRYNHKPLAQKDSYHREPFAVDVSEGKSDEVYNAHSYHTKVPYRAIMRAILHYTEPGDLILDGFAGSGMTGVAAQMCGNALPTVKAEIEQEWSKAKRPKPKWGLRRIVLNDLGPAATAIASGFNLPFDRNAFGTLVDGLLAKAVEQYGWMYQTLHSDGKTLCPINYTVWSEVFSCSECDTEFIFFKEAFNKRSEKVREEFPCPHCKAELTKARSQRVFETIADLELGKPRKQIRLVPIAISYSVGRSRYSKEPDTNDKENIRQAASLRFPKTVPTMALPTNEMYHGTRLVPKGFTHVHHLFLPREAHVVGWLWEQAVTVQDARLRSMLLFWLDSHLVNLSIQNRYRPGVSFPYNPLTGVYYVSSLVSEANPFIAYENKYKRLLTAFNQSYAQPGAAIIGTGDCGSLSSIQDQTIDYIFTDPPFGENIFYADLNIQVEAWYRVRTNPATEAIVDGFKEKGLLEYQRLMQGCFEEYYRTLKPGRWMTVVFHNSKNAVWNAIQEAMLAARFIVADVRTLDKQQGSYRQVTSTAVKQDLVISAYRPPRELEESLKVSAGHEDSAWEFVKSHLRQVPGFVSKDGRLQVIAERQPYLLYDRMVAFHVQRGLAVPLSSAEFHAGLRQRFPERDGMCFVANQVAEYDRNRLEVEDIEQYEIFVSDEKSAIQWVHRQLTDQPLSYQKLQPLYMKEAQRVWEKHEQPLELRRILEENFVEDKDGSWRVPDPKRESDLEQLRHRGLMKEFQQYLDLKGKLKIIRTEALRAGFKECWQRQDYSTIVQMAKRVPEAAIQEDAALLMYYDNALMRTGE
jgi:DNA modification methylase